MPTSSRGSVDTQHKQIKLPSPVPGIEECRELKCIGQGEIFEATMTKLPKEQHYTPPCSLKLYTKAAEDLEMNVPELFSGHCRMH